MNSVFIILLLSLIILMSLAQVVNAERIAINGTTYDTTWDGRVIPTSQIVYGTFDDTILETDFPNARTFTTGNDTITIPKSNNIVFKREKFKVSPSLTFSKTGLQNNMVNVNATVAYLLFSYQLSRLKDWSDDHNIRFGRWNFDTGIIIYDDNETINYLNNSAYDFRIVNDEIRLYFLKPEANKLQGNITFEMDSWVAFNGSTSPAWQNGSSDNTTTSANNATIVRGISFDDFNRANNVNENANTGKTKWKDILAPASGEIKNNTLLLNDTYDDIQDLDVTVSMSNYTVVFCTEKKGASKIVVGVYKNDTTQKMTGTSYYYSITFDGNSNSITSPTSTKTGADLTYACWAADTSTIHSGMKLYRNGTLYHTFSAENYINATNGSVSFSTNDRTAQNYIDNYNVYYTNQTSGNRTQWHDFGAGRQGANVMFNFTNATGLFIDAYASTDNFTSSDVLVADNITNATWTAIPASAKNQTQYVRAVLKGNTTSTPELMEVLIEDEATETPSIGEYPFWVGWID